MPHFFSHFPHFFRIFPHFFPIPATAFPPPPLQDDPLCMNPPSVRCGSPLPSKAPFEKKQSKRMIYKLKCRIKFHAIQLDLERGTTELCQGAAEWASKVPKRKLVFKDLARRATMTKAAKSGLPLPETSKYFKVRPNTMMVYHQASITFCACPCSKGH